MITESEIVKNNNEEVNVYTFQPTGNQQQPGVTITIKDPIPDTPRSEETIGDFMGMSHDKFMMQAEKLFQALRYNLPGGTFDRLLGLMLMDKASHFVVSDYEPMRGATCLYADENLSPAECRLVELDLMKPAVDKYYRELEETLRTIAMDKGIQHWFETSDGVVVQLQIPDGRYHSYPQFSYVRTKREGERAGSLSQKAADALRQEKETRLRIEEDARKYAGSFTADLEVEEPVIVRQMTD